MYVRNDKHMLLIYNVCERRHVLVNWSHVANRCIIYETKREHQFPFKWKCYGAISLNSDLEYILYRVLYGVCSDEVK